MNQSTPKILLSALFVSASMLSPFGGATSRAALPVRDCTACVGFATPSTGTLTDAWGTSLQVLLEHVENGECTTECDKTDPCKFSVEQEVSIGPGGGGSSFVLSVTFEGSTRHTAFSAPGLPAGTYPLDIDLEAKCGEFYSYTVNAKTGTHPQLIKQVTYSCSTCTEAPVE